MGIPKSKLGRDFIVAEPDEPLGNVMRRLIHQGGSDYTFLLVRTGGRWFLACQFGKLKRRLTPRAAEALFSKPLWRLSADFTKVPAVQRDELDLAAARRLAQENPLRLVVVMEYETVVGYIWLVSRTVYPGASLIERFQSFLHQIPAVELPKPKPPKPWSTLSPKPAGYDELMKEAPRSSKEKIVLSKPEMTMAEPPSVPARNVVNTGFTTRLEPKVLLDKTRPLAPASDYYFVLGVGEVLAGSIEATPTALPESLPSQAVLQVALFAFAGEFELDPQASLGLLRLREDGSAVVVRQPGEQTAKPEVPWLLFPVRTPSRTGRMRLRCNIYYRQCLVQSRLVSAQVDPAEEWSGAGPALVSELDYTLSQSMAAGHLAGIQEHRLSLMINDNGDGTHGFRFFGREEFKSDAQIDGQELQGLIDYARAALRKSAWGDENPYTDQPYRYDGPPDPQRLRQDLISLAVRGYRIYDQIINRLAGGAAQAQTLAQLMGSSGLVQIALKQSARFVLPAALIYDYPLDTNADPGDYALCQQFQEALEGPAELEACRCFAGECPSRGDDLTICPSGFWGFRHELGMPLSLADAPDAPTEIPVQGSLNFVISVCLDPAFKLRPNHETSLHSLLAGAQWRRADSRKATFEALKAAQPHLVYFYCHGGLTASQVPYLQVGKMTERGITRDNLRAKGVVWSDPRPLVFINGCHTAALEPETAFELVSGFVETAGAAGVIGTEITIFEPLATAFAERFWLEFSRGVEVGEAIRKARLALLKQSNPLGLVYIPYTMAGLHIKI